MELLLKQQIAIKGLILLEIKDVARLFFSDESGFDVRIRLRLECESIYSEKGLIHNQPCGQVCSLARQFTRALVKQERRVGMHYLHNNLE